MIPAIGLMVGLYIIVRMIELIGMPDRGRFLKISAGVTILVTIISIVDILSKGSSVAGRF